MKNLLIAQSGGPTAVINATLAGIIEYAYANNQVDQVFGAINGIQGVLEERFIDLREKVRNSVDINLLCQTPAAALGSCRFKLADYKNNKEQYRNIINILKKKQITYFIYIGGNDSMDTVDKLSSYCNQQGITDITIVGAPKTIDNDLIGTDHSPGFGSAAKYIGITFAELERDCRVYASKAVTIVEVMGRNTGWLTAASSLARLNGNQGPDLIYLCEHVFDEDKFLNDVRQQLKYKPSVLIAVSEGIKNRDGNYISHELQKNTSDSFGHNYLSGASKVLEETIRKEIGCKVRSVELNLMQRCAGHLASRTDVREARSVGMRACQYATEGRKGVMAAIIRTSNAPYQIIYKPVPVCSVSNRERKVPDCYINEEGNDVTISIIDYLRPLIEGQTDLEYDKGIPKYIDLY